MSEQRMSVEEVQARVAALRRGGDGFLLAAELEAGLADRASLGRVRDGLMVERARSLASPSHIYEQVGVTIGETCAAIEEALAGEEGGS